MNSKPHYFAIGVFVLAATVLGLLGLIAFSSDALRSPKYFLETYVDESVQGIDVGTPFKFRGVKIGNVSEISMVSSEYETDRMYVLIRVALNDKKMLENPEIIPERVQKQVADGLRMKLVPQGITGLSFLEAEYYPETDAAPLEIDWEPKYTYIPSTPALMTLLSRTIEHITADLSTLDIQTIGNNVETLSSNLNLVVQHVEQITRNAKVVSGDVADNVKWAAADLPVMTSNLNATVCALEQIAGDSDRSIDQILTNMRKITEDAHELILMLRRYPGMLLAEPPEPNLSK
jgi:phospholipid/cholesterol/gamma-HCH transport system substrate-binding protein/paraquat-inducible protein B